MSLDCKNLYHEDANLPYNDPESLQFHTNTPAFLLDTDVLILKIHMDVRST